MIFVISVICNRGVLCQDIGKWAEILAVMFFFYVVSKTYNPALSIFGNFVQPTLVYIGIYSLSRFDFHHGILKFTSVGGCKNISITRPVNCMRRSKGPTSIGLGIINHCLTKWMFWQYETVRLSCVNVQGYNAWAYKRAGDVRVGLLFLYLVSRRVTPSTWSA